MPRFHISKPIVDYRTDGHLRYSIFTSIKGDYYQGGESSSYNMSLTKSVIQYDTSINPQNERPSTSTYSLQSYQNL